MGNHCSAKLIKREEHITFDPAKYAVGGEEDGCGDMCGLASKEPEMYSNPHFPLSFEHLLQEREDGTPRTPRPVPPWAIVNDSPAVDLTATGPTPPRSPKPPRAIPPGVPDSENPRRTMVGASLGAQLGPDMAQDLFAAARSGNAKTICALLQSVSSCAHNIVANASGAAARQSDAELVATYLSDLRNAGGGFPRHTLLGLAASSGHVEVVQALLSARADPLVTDDQGCNALHRAAESGRLLTVLLVLDRIQAKNRTLSTTDLQSTDGKTPEMFAALAGASDICKALEIHSDMQSNVELRHLGPGTTDQAGSTSSNLGAAGEVISLLDLQADARSTAGRTTTAALQRSIAGNGLVQDICGRLPTDADSLKQLVIRVTQGLIAAEDILLTTSWKQSENSNDPILRSFATTASLRCEWQRIRSEAVAAEQVEGLDDYWSTHLTARRMASTLHSSRGDVFQLLLAVLWLYTREAWLCHILDALCSVLCAAGVPHLSLGGSSQIDGTTGAAPPGLPPSLESLAPLVAALAPFMQMLQSALIWFDEAGRRHTAMTYRPLLLPMRSLQRLIEKYNRTSEAASNSKDGASLPGGPNSLQEGTWISLGNGALFSAMSSRQDAIKRMTRMRCSVLLVLKPDDTSPCYPKQMSLSSGVTDDILFPLGALYRVTRMTRKDIDLDSPHNGSGGGRWPVVILEVSAASRYVEATELLEQRGDLRPGRLEVQLQLWTNGSPAGRLHDRQLEAGEALLRAAGSRAAVGGNTNGGTGEPPPGRYEAARTMLDRAAQGAEEAGDVSVAAKAILASARCRITAGMASVSEVLPEGKRALRLLEEEFGSSHPETCTVRQAWRDLGVNV